MALGRSSSLLDHPAWRVFVYGCLLLVLCVQWGSSESLDTAAIPRRPRIAVVSLYFPKPEGSGPAEKGGGIRSDGRKWLQKNKAAAIENHKSYARRHGYDHVHLNTSLHPDSAHWTKLIGVRDVLASHKHDWVLYLDSDAIVVHPETSITNWLTKYPPASATGLIFAGDTLFINNGVMLLRGDPRPAATRAAIRGSGDSMSGAQWVLQLLEDSIAIGPERSRLAPAFDQGVMVALMAGCTRTSSAEEIQACYQGVDMGYKAAMESGNRSIEFAIRAGNLDHPLLKDMLPAHVRPYVQLVPDTALNSRVCETAELVCHFPNMYRKHRANKIHHALQMVARQEKEREKERDRQRTVKTGTATRTLTRT